MTSSTTNIKRKYFPSSFLIIIGLMLFFVVLSWILKAAGVTTYNRADDKNVSIIGLGILDFIVAIWQGFKDRADVILFILAIGGTLAIISRTKAVDVAIERVIFKLQNRVIWIIPILMLLFGLGGTTYGMWEETIAFFPILIPIFIKAKFGPFLAVVTILLGSGIGCLASTVNPFSIAIAFESAKGANPPLGVDVGQSILLGSRWLSWIVFEVIAILAVTFMAIRIRSNKLQITGLNDKYISDNFKISNDEIKFTLRRKITVAFFILSFVLMILSYLPWSSWINGVDNAGNDSTTWDKYFFWIASTNVWSNWGTWYFISIAGVFFLVSLIILAINLNDFKSVDENVESSFIRIFINGSKDVLPVCLIIATAAGLGVILSKSNIDLWIANSASSLSSLGIIGFTIFIFFLSLLLSLFVPSTSGFAAAFIPIFAGITYKAFGNESAKVIEGIIGLIIMAFIFASGIANLFTPTSAALMAYTQYGGVPYNVWIKRIWPFLIGFVVLSILLLIIFAVMVQNSSYF